MGKDVAHLLVDENGERKSWSEFYKDYKKVDGKYNSQWLAAEYDMATKQAHSAVDWQIYERDKDVYPNLKYMPSMANEPRVDHEHYYGLVPVLMIPFGTISCRHRFGVSMLCRTNLRTCLQQSQFGGYLTTTKGHCG